MTKSCCSSNNEEPVLQQTSCCSSKVETVPSSCCSTPVEPVASSCCSTATAEPAASSCCSTATAEPAASSCCSSTPAETEAFDLLPPNKQMKDYFVDGMDCGSCALTLENHLNANPAVKQVQVKFSTGRMKIEHDNSPEEIMKEVAKVGFKATLITHENKNNAGASANSSMPVIMSGVLIALGYIASKLDISTYIPIALFAVAMVISGRKPVKSAYYAIRSRSLDMNVLMSAAAIGAALLGEWLEGATVVWLFSLGLNLQTRAIEKTRSSIRGLMDLAPAEAWVKIGSELVKKPVEEVVVNDIIVVKPGDRIPLDGDVIDGESSVNQAAITGESIPVDKEIGSIVYAGSINEHGSLTIHVTKLTEDTTIAKIIHLVEEAQEKKAPTEAFIDKFARIYTPIVFALALLIIVAPPLLGFGAWSEWIYKGLMLLVIACPCALVISTPVAIVTALGNAAKQGVLIKGGTFLEQAGMIDAIAFDKTGTLTEGRPVVTDIIPFTADADELLAVARTLEEHSTHPIAKTVVDYAKTKMVAARNGSSFKNLAGRGVQATIDGQLHYAGNAKLFMEIGVPIEAHQDEIDRLQNEGKTLIIIGTTAAIAGVICVSDTIRQTTRKSIDQLKKIGVSQIVMLTGDNEGTAKAIAAEAGVNRHFAELLPEGKVEAIKQLQAEGYHVAMVGDGINDAPALATADLGIAMGGAGTDTAMETADIVLMADNLEKLSHTMKLSRKSITIIKQNIWFSIIIKVIALVLIFPGWLTLWIAVLSDTGAALIVILNSLRLLRVKD